MDNAGKIDNAGQMDEFEPAALHSSRAKGSRKRRGGVHMHSEAVGNPASACCMYGSARPPPWRGDGRFPACSRLLAPPVSHGLGMHLDPANPFPTSLCTA